MHLEYLRYIEYERHLHLLLNKRCDKLALKQSGAIRFSCIERIRTIFDRCVRRYPSELSLWRAFIEFCQECCLDGALSDIFGRALQVHPLQAEIWVKAAFWEYRRNKNIDAARSLFQRALRVIPQNPTIWLEFFRLEADFLDTIRRRIDVLGVAPTISSSKSGALEDMIEFVSDEEEEGFNASGDDKKDSQKKQVQTRFTLASSFMAAALPKAIFKGAINAIPGDMELRLSFVRLSAEFAGYGAFRQHVYRSILENFPNSEKAIDIWCRRACLEAAASAPEHQSACQLMALENYRTHLLAQRYQQDISHGIWDLYIEFLTSTLTQLPARSQQHTLFLSRLFEAFKFFFEHDNPDGPTAMKPERWIKWIDILLSCGLIEDAQQTLQRACTHFPTNETLWKLSFRFAAVRIPDSLPTLLATLRKFLFENSHKHGDLIALWQLYISSLAADRTISFKRLLRDMRQIFVLLSPASIAILKSTFLQIFVNRSATPELMSSFYHVVLQHKPNQMSFLTDCISWELTQLTVDPIRIRRLFTVAIDEYGTVNSSLWLDYIRFEKVYGTIEHVTSLYRKARRILRHPAGFVLEYARMNEEDLNTMSRESNSPSTTS